MCDYLLDRIPGLEDVQLPAHRPREGEGEDGGERAFAARRQALPQIGIASQGKIISSRNKKSF
jgi:hypothetical protein